MNKSSDTVDHPQPNPAFRVSTAPPLKSKQRNTDAKKLTLYAANVNYFTTYGCYLTIYGCFITGNTLMISCITLSFNNVMADQHQLDNREGKRQR